MFWLNPMSVPNHAHEAICSHLNVAAVARRRALMHLIRAKGPFVFLAEPNGLGDGRKRIVEGQRPGHLSNFGLRRCRNPANGRAFGPQDKPLLPRFPGRWPGLGKLLGLRPDGQNRPVESI